MNAKKTLREFVKLCGSAIDMDTKVKRSCRICDSIKGMEEFVSADKIMCYWSMPDEVFTHDFIVEVSKSKAVYLPVIKNDTLLISEFAGEAEMVCNKRFPVMEPTVAGDSVGIDDMDMIIVPGMAFDKQGGRLGRGKGFYDRLLSGSSIFKLGVCFDYQYFERIPREEHDILMDKVIFG